MKSRPLFLSLYLIYSVLIGTAVQSQKSFGEVDKVLDNHLNKLGNNVCVLVSKNDKIVYSYQHGDYDPNTKEMIASCSKWLTAALVMTFVDEGKISVDDPVCKYLPNFNTPDKKNILIRHCLSHTSGIHSEPITLASLREHRKYHSLGEEVNNFANQLMDGAPGSVFAYSTVGLNIAGRVLEVISGRDFEDLFQERIARPLEMKNTTFVLRGAINPSGGASSSPTDYLHFLSMILNEGNYHGKHILTTSSVALMQQSCTVQTKVLYAPEQAEGVEYGFGEWIHKKGSDNRGIVVSSPGLFGSFPYVNREDNYVAMVFVKNLKVKNRRETNKAILSAIDDAMKIQSH